MSDLPPSECPSCGYRLDAATHPTDPAARPRPGDLSTCIECVAPLVFTPDLSLRLLSIAEIGALPAGERRALADAQAIVRNLPRWA